MILHIRTSLLALIGLFASAIPSSADMVVKVSYTEVHDRILPTANVTRTKVQLEARVQQSGSVQQNESRSSGRVGGASSNNLKLGAGGGSSWRVAGPNQLVNIVNYQTYERAILVTVDGKSCSVRVNYTLKGGATDYRYRRLTNSEIAVARSVTSTDQSCSVSGN